MIRQEMDLNKGSNRLKSYAWMFLFIFGIVVSTSTLAWQGKEWGLPVFVLLVGVATVCVLAVLTIIVGLVSRKNADPAPKRQSIAVNASFLASKLPSIILEDGQVSLANDAYMDMARGLNVEFADGVPPSLGKLFESVDKDGAAAIYRLHHAPGDGRESQETIRMQTDNGVRVFNISISSFDNEQLWTICDCFSETASSQPLFSEAPIGLFSMQSDGKILAMNAVLRGWLGFEGKDFPQNIDEFIDNPESIMESTKVPGQVVRSDTQLKTQKGVLSPTVMSGSWHEDGTGEVYASVALYGHSGLSIAPDTPNVSTKGSAVETNLNADVFGDAPFGVFRLDNSDLLIAKVIGGNAAFANMVGESIVAKEKNPVLFTSLFVPSEKTTEFLQLGITSEDRPVDLQLASAKNCQVNVYFSKSGDGNHIAYMVDVSNRKILEDQLMQSQKMQAIGQLAGGIAHDFNNLLTVIRLNTDELLGRHPIGDPSYPELREINQTVARSADLVGNLLAFSRKQTRRVETLDVTDTLSDISVMLKRVMVERIALDVVHGRNLPPILVDRSQFISIFMNLCVNARDAMVETGKPGTITLKSFKASADDYAKDDVPPPKDGEFVVIQVTDTGTGMSAEMQKKIFEPFFTTKEQGKGTGLGLATVYGIVEQSGGHLRVESTIGVGTTFKVYIPTGAKEALDKATVSSTPKTVKPANLSGQGKILFVEDEDAVRAIAAKTLRKRGYTVIEACDGEEAFEILEEGNDRFDLMISDVVMPGMDGPTLLKQGRKMLGDAQIVFISGYAKEEFSELLADEPDVTFLPKPFTLAQLAEKVKSVIGEAN